MTNTPDEAARELVKKLTSPNEDRPVLMADTDGLFYFVDQPLKKYNALELVHALGGNGNGNGKTQKAKLVAKPAAIEPSRPLPIDNGNGKHRFALSRKPMPLITNFSHVSEETINLQAGNLMPRSDKLLFIDPKAIELPIKAAPKMRVIIEHMSKPVQKKPIDPRLLIAIGIMAVMAVIGLTVLYSQVIEPAQKAEREYNLKVLQNGGNATGLGKAPGSGGLFQFQPPNPFGPPPSIH